MTDGIGADIIGIDGRERPRTGAQPEVVELARKVLDLAESGELQQLAVVGADRDGGTFDAYAPGGPIETMRILPVIGGLELCKATLVNQIVGGEDA